MDIASGLLELIIRRLTVLSNLLKLSVRQFELLLQPLHLHSRTHRHERVRARAHTHASRIQQCKCTNHFVDATRDSGHKTKAAEWRRMEQKSQIWHYLEFALRCSYTAENLELEVLGLVLLFALDPG